MADFFNPPDGFPFLPDVPDEPAPKIEDLGTSFGVGLGKSGLVGGLLGPLFDILMRVFVTVIGWLLTKILTLAAFLIKIVGQVENDASLGLGQVASATLQNVFGVTVDPSAFATRAGGTGRAAAAQAIGNALIQTIFPAAQAQASTTIPPGDTAVKAFAGAVTQIELTGWLESVVSDLLSYHLLEKYGDIKDSLVKALGISRMSRQAFAPLVKLFLHDPYEQILNTKYRPKPIPEELVMDAFNRGTINEDQVEALLAPQGYSPTYQQWLYDKTRKRLPDADVEYLLQRGTWTQDQAVSYLEGEGWDNVSAALILQVAQDKRLQPYRQKAISIATEAYVRGDMDQGSLQSLINSSGLTDEENSWLMTIANLERQSKVTHLSRGDIEQGILDGVMSLNDLDAWATRVNMPKNEETLLELQILFKQGQKTAAAVAKAAAQKARADALAAKQAAAVTKAAAVKAAAPDKGVTIAQAEALVKSGDWTFDQLTNFLTAKGYGADAITSIELLLHESMGKTTAAAPTVATAKAVAKAKGLNLSQVEKAVIDGILSPSDLTNFLSTLGFDASDAAVVVAEVQKVIDAAAAKAAAKAAAQAKAGKKNISLVNLERAVKLGITPIATYTTALQAAGFDPADTDLLTSTLSAEIAASTAKAPAKGATSTTTAARAATLAQIEQEVLAGVRPIADYTAALATDDYSESDQDQLTQLLQVRVDHSKHAAALHFDAQGKATAKGISLSAAEQGVLAALNTMADYDALLVSLGYDDVDRATLEALLQARVAAKAAKAAA